MINKLKETYKNRKVNKLKENNLFQEPIAMVKILYGEFPKNNRDRMWHVAFELGVDEKCEIIDATLEINDHNDILIRGKVKENGLCYYRKIPVSLIQWRKLYLSGSVKLHQNLLTPDDSNGMINIPLTDDRSVIIRYDKNKRSSILDTPSQYAQ